MTSEALVPRVAVELLARIGLAGLAVGCFASFVWVIKGFLFAQPASPARCSGCNSQVP